MIQYEEKQTFATWIYLVVFGGDFAIVGWLVYIAATENSQALWMIPMMFILMLWLWDLFRTTTRISDGKLYFQIGGLIPLMWKNIPLEEISDARVVQYKPLRDCGGWGYRWGKFEGEPATFCNAQGNRGVFFRTPNQNFIFGSQQPERLLLAINDAQKYGK